MKNISLIIFILVLADSSHAQTRSLEYYINHAFATSPLLDEYRNQIELNRLDSQIFRASLKTQVNFLSYNYYAPIINGYGYDEPISNIANASALVQASRNFISKNNLSTQLQSLSFANRSLSDTLQYTEREVKKAIADQYILVYGNLLALNFKKEILDLLMKEDITLKKLTQNNVYKQADYLAFYVNLQQYELDYMQSAILYEADFRTLNYLAGIRDTTLYNLEKPELNENLHFEFNNSVFYKKYVNDSLLIENEKMLIKYEYRPKFGAFTNAGYNSTMQITPLKNFGFSAGFMLSVPIYDAHQKNIKYSKLDIKERTRVNNREFYSSQYSQQISQLKKQLVETDKLTEKVHEQVAYVKSLITESQRLLKTGDYPIPDLLSEINNYLIATNMLHHNLVSRLYIINQLHYWNN